MGRCDNLDGVAATCTPMAARTGAGAAEDGLVRYDVSVAVDAGAKGQHIVVLHLRVPEANAAELEQHYRGAVARPCTAIVIRPPCNPAGSDVVIPTLPVPAYASREFY